MKVIEFMRDKYVRPMIRTMKGEYLVTERDVASQGISVYRQYALADVVLESVMEGKHILYISLDSGDRDVL